MADKKTHFEEYIYLAGLTHNAAFIAWGGFEFKVKGELDGGDLQLIDDSDRPARHGSIGVSSDNFSEEGQIARLQVTDTNTNKTVEFGMGGANFAFARDLAPDTLYTYRVMVKRKGESQFREWAAGPLRDWVIKEGKGRLSPSKKTYKNEFRTFPDPRKESPALTFAVIGDFGRGVRKQDDAVCQRDIAEALEQATDVSGVRFILTTGDNIYKSIGQGSGAEDDDWFFTYFQPYRYVINRVPVYPTIGNHDDGEDEERDDREQVMDNLFIKARFTRLQDVRESLLDPGLFYRFRYGADIEFICIDTSKKSGSSKRYFELPEPKEFLESTFAVTESAPKWRIPFSHHPRYCAGPLHGDTEEMEDLVRMFARAGVRAVFAGHEHNFQHASDETKIAYFITGGAGKVRTGEPSKKDFLRHWGGNNEGHFLMVEVEGDVMKVTPVARRGPSGTARKLTIRDRNGAEVGESTITVSL
jgi:tartrate-resistant acid phosphatase type 5